MPSLIGAPTASFAMKKKVKPLRMGLSRREFIALMGAAAAGASIGGCSFGDKDFPSIDEWSLNQEEWITTSCHQCPGRCGMLARVVDGKLKRLMGNPLHPISQGGLCPAGHSALQSLYHPERLRTALRRVGDKGSGQFEAVGWKEPIEMLAGKLAELRKKNAPEGLAILTSDAGSLRSRVVRRFAEAFGTPNLFAASRNAGVSHVFRYMQGTDGPVGYDLRNANYILSFGADLVGAMFNPAAMSRIYGHLRQERPGRKAKIVQVEPRLSPSATRADRWTPIRIGTEGALAMGIANVLIKEERYDGDFVRRRCFGFEDWTDENGERRLGFKSLVLNDYRTETVSELTGIPDGVIVSIAKEFSESRPAVALFDESLARRPNGVYAGMAIHALNALMGSFEIPGGVVMQTAVPFAELAEVRQDEAARSGLKKKAAHSDDGNGTLDGAGSMDEFLRTTVGRKVHGIQVLVLDGVNPMFTHPGAGELEAFLKSVPMVVSVSPFLDETSKFADLALPNHTFLERFDLGETPDIAGRSVLSVTQPAVKPLYDTMDTGDLLIRIAHSIGGDVGDSFPWENFEEIMAETVRGGHQIRRGTVFDEEEREKQAEQLERRGWWFPEFEDSEEFAEALMKRGGWWDPHYARGEWWRVFKTPTGKFEFFSTLLKGKLGERMERFRGIKDEATVLGELELAAHGEALCLPHHEAYSMAGDEREFPFEAYPYRLLTLRDGERANQPWMQEILSPLNTVQWGSWVELNPKDAAALGIAHGGDAVVESPNGRIRARVVTFAGIQPGTVGLPFGQGHDSFGRWADGMGANPVRLLGKTADRLSGVASHYGVRVKIAKA